MVKAVAGGARNMRSGGRIGKVTTWWTNDPVNPHFRLVVESGKVVLAAFRYIESEPFDLSGPEPELRGPPRGIFVRMS